MSDSILEQYVQGTVNDNTESYKLIQAAQASAVISIKKLEIEVEKIKHSITYTQQNVNLNKLLAAGTSIEMLFCELQKIRLRYLQ